MKKNMRAIAALMALLVAAMSFTFALAEDANGMPGNPPEGMPGEPPEGSMPGNPPDGFVFIRTLYSSTSAAL